MKIGIITYNHNHLKTEQVVHILASNSLVKKIHLLALPYETKKFRKPLINHRPNMETGVLTSELSTVDKITFQIWDGRSEVPEYLDFFIICGAGILDLSFARGKPVINAHPGIAPE